MNWKNIQINIQNIECETGSATLIKMPNKSDYEGYSFWHPSKLIRKGNNSYSVSLGYNDNFTFKLKKYGKGKWNKREVINEIEISVEEFEVVFKVMESCTQKSKVDSESYLVVKEPEKLEKEVEIVEELKNGIEL